MSYWEGRLRQYCPIGGHLNFFANGHPKTQKNVFFCISHNYSTFWCRRPYMGSTMRKLTSWRFQKCVTYRGSEFLNGSYCCSKSTESEIFDSSPKISGVTKKRHGHNNENWVPKRIAPQDNPIGCSFYSFRASILKIDRVSCLLYTSPSPRDPE